MKLFVILAAIAAVCLADSVTVLYQSELTDEIIQNRRYLLTEREDGLIQVEDLHNFTFKSSPFVTEDDITYHFYTPENPSNGVPIKESQLLDIVRLTGFDINRKTLVIIHGWRNNYGSPVNEYIKNAAFQSKNINVIVVDWGPIANNLYLIAQDSVLAVGNYIGDFLLRLDGELNHRLNKVTLVGHSLGAHISGNAGARTHGLINTINGLDPAGPLFHTENTDHRLDPTDAGYVHVIHTNDGRLGFSLKMGHADYYPNGGRSQPGCGIDLVGSCAHIRAYEYFAESLNNNNFRSRLCKSWENFKEDQCNSNTECFLGSFPIQRCEFGNYYLYTNSISPFARG